MSYKPIYVPKIYKQVLCDTKATFKVFYSGRAAAKSNSFARALLNMGIHIKLRIMCGRQFQSNIDESVKTLLMDLIDEYQLHDCYKYNDKVIRGVNGTVFSFRGLERNKTEIKGMEGIDIFWIEEGQILTQETIDLLLPTVLRNKGSELWVSMNVKSKDDPAYKEFIANPRPNSVITKTSFLNNPFITDDALSLAAWCKIHDPKKYNHIWLGEPQDTSELSVFDNWRIGRTITDEEAEKYDLTPYFGLDFGYSVDPTALIKLYVLEDERELHIVDEAYEYKVEIDNLVDLIKRVPKAYENYITADSARPETISHLNNHGCHVIASKKGPGSVLEGVEFLRNYKIIIHPKCINAQYDFGHYIHETDKQTGRIRPDKFVKENDHLCDAARYSLELYREHYKQILSTI